MACDISVHGSARAAGPARAAVDRALAVFTHVDATCTRFDPASPLMRMNARPDRWHRVPPLLFRAVEEAHRAYLRTHGRFDPRVLRDLVDLGYDRSLPFAQGGVVTAGSRRRRPATGPWRPRFRGGSRPELHLGGEPVDLGGIGKGLAVRWAAECLDGHLDAYLIDAGGDCACRGAGPDGDGWRIGVEDPLGRSDRPLAVIEIRDRAVATSSTRLRHWRAGDEAAHHLLDPATGRPGGEGLVAVTVIADDPAEAEVACKALFLAGSAGVADGAQRRNVAALWVDATGRTVETRRFTPSVIWRAA
jgi:thiamine biosynthesis lipoprotein